MSESEALHPWTITLGELDEKIGIVVEEQSAQRVVVTFPVDGNRQSLGLLHGGTSLAVGEAAGSWAAVIHASTLDKEAVGVDVNATHHASATRGNVRAVASAIRLGRRMTSHEVVLTHIETGRRLCTLRITNLLVDKH